MEIYLYLINTNKTMSIDDLLSLMIIERKLSVSDDGSQNSFSSLKGYFLNLLDSGWIVQVKGNDSRAEELVSLMKGDDIELSESDGCYLIRRLFKGDHSCSFDFDNLFSCSSDSGLKGITKTVRRKLNNGVRVDVACRFGDGIVDFNKFQRFISYFNHRLKDVFGGTELAVSQGEATLSLIPKRRIFPVPVYLYERFNNELGAVSFSPEQIEDVDVSGYSSLTRDRVNDFINFKNLSQQEAVFLAVTDAKRHFFRYVEEYVDFIEDGDYQEQAIFIRDNEVRKARNAAFSTLKSLSDFNPSLEELVGYAKSVLDKTYVSKLDFNRMDYKLKRHLCAVGLLSYLQKNNPGFSLDIGAPNSRFLYRGVNVAQFFGESGSVSGHSLNQVNLTPVDGLLNADGIPVVLLTSMADLMSFNGSEALTRLYGVEPLFLHFNILQDCFSADGNRFFFGRDFSVPVQGSASHSPLIVGKTKEAIEKELRLSASFNYLAELGVSAEKAESMSTAVAVADIETIKANYSFLSESVGAPHDEIVDSADFLCSRKLLSHGKTAESLYRMLDLPLSQIIHLFKGSDLTFIERNLEDKIDFLLSTVGLSKSDVKDNISLLAKDLVFLRRTYSSFVYFFPENPGMIKQFPKVLNAGSYKIAVSVKNILKGKPSECSLEDGSPLFTDADCDAIRKYDAVHGVAKKYVYYAIAFNSVALRKSEVHPVVRLLEEYGVSPSVLEDVPMLKSVDLLHLRKNLEYLVVDKHLEPNEVEEFRFMLPYALWKISMMHKYIFELKKAPLSDLRKPHRRAELITLFRSKSFYLNNFGRVQ